MEWCKLEDFAVLKASFSRHVIVFPHLNFTAGIIQQLGETVSALTILVSLQTLSYSVNPSMKAWPFVR